MIYVEPFRTSLIYISDFVYIAPFWCRIKYCRSSFRPVKPPQILLFFWIIVSPFLSGNHKFFFIIVVISSATGFVIIKIFLGVVFFPFCKSFFSRRSSWIRFLVCLVFFGVFFTPSICSKRSAFSTRRGQTALFMLVICKKGKIL